MIPDDENTGTGNDDADGELPVAPSDADSVGEDDSQGHALFGGETNRHPDGDEPTSGFRAV